MQFGKSQNLNSFKMCFEVKDGGSTSTLGSRTSETKEANGCRFQPMRLLPFSSSEFQSSMPKLSVPKAPSMTLELSLRHGALPVVVSFTNFRPKGGM